MVWKILKFAYEPTHGDLFTFSAMKDLCALEAEYLLPHVNTSCPLMSLPYYVALLAGKGACHQLEEKDFLRAEQILQQCAQFYVAGSLLPNGAVTEKKADVPAVCIRGDFVYIVLRYLTDSSFFDEEAPYQRRPLKLCITYWMQNLTKKFNGVHLYRHHIENRNIHKGGVKFTALDFPPVRGVIATKFAIFSKYVIEDVKYFAIAGGLVLLIMLLYMQSMVVVLSTVLNIAFSFIISYWVYYYVFGLKFFPFINLLAGLILVAVGADDVFIFYDCWLQVKKERADRFEAVVTRTLTTASLAILVTSLTTASAFFSNLLSDVTITQCFGIFSGLSILVNFVLMVTWTPSVIILSEVGAKKLRPYFHCFLESSCCRVSGEMMERLSSFIFDTVLPTVVGKLWFVWVSLVLALGAGACVAVFVTPQLRLPDSEDLQVFPASNPFEHWELAVKHRVDGLQDTVIQRELPLHFIWGFLPKDQGYKLDPDDIPKTLIPDRDFDFYSTESQVWLTKVCRNLLNASFVDPRYVARRICYMDAYVRIIQKYCAFEKSSSQSNDVVEKCCSDFEIPFDPLVLKMCFPLVTWYYAANNKNGGRVIMLGGNYNILGLPLFGRDNAISGIDIEILAKYEKSYDYELQKSHYMEIQQFLQKQLETAPQGLKTGFFHAWTKFALYDLQNAIAQGTFYSVGVSLIVAFSLMLITSRNVLLAIYAIVTIALAIMSTVASVVLLGWTLNVIESITISMAVGLSIDFTIHYGVAYRLSSQRDAKSRVNESFKRVGGAVAMAALTTFVTGAAVMPSRILLYTKLGTFLMLCMTFSWTYATFFFQSVCWIIGPRGNFCQLGMHCLRPCRKNSSSAAAVDSDADGGNRLEALDPSAITDQNTPNHGESSSDHRTPLRL